MTPRHPLFLSSGYRLGRLVEEETFARLDRSRDLLAAQFDQRIPLHAAAAEACLSPFHYHRMFVRAFGETPHQFLTRMRIERARQLLAREDCPITEVCLSVGYESLGTFSSRFRELVGRSPSEYRREMRRIFPVPRLAPYRFIPACFLISFGSRPF